MKTYEEFKKEYQDYLNQSKKTASEDEIKKKYAEYKSNTGKDVKDEVKKAAKTSKIKVKSPVDTKIKELLTRLVALRVEKKAGKEVAKDISIVSKELSDQRKIKKSVRTPTAD